MAKTLTIASVFVLLYNLLFYHIQPGIGMGLLVFALNLYYYLTKDPQSKEVNIALFFSALSTLFGFLFGFRDSGVVQVVNYLGSLFFSGIAFYLYKSKQPFSFRVINTVLMPLVSFKDYWLSAFSSLIDKDNWESKRVNSDKSSALVKGIVIVVPLVFILFLLLANADPVFAKLANLLIKDVKERVILSVVIFVYLLIVAKTVIRAKLLSGVEEKLKEVGVGKPYELFVVLGAVTLLFLSFIFVQFKYLFSKVGETDLSSIGISSQTYSEYVNRGFFELLVVSAISALMIVYVLRFLHQLVGREKLITQILSSLLIIETGLILLSAYQRVNLYVQDHGLTRARGFGMVFFFWLSLILLILLLEVVKKQTHRHLFFSTGTITLLALLAFNLIDIDGLMATKFKPTVNGEVDYFYLTNISSDAYPAWKETLEQAKALLPSLKKKSLSPEDGRKLYYLSSSLENLQRSTGYLMDKYGPDEALAKKYKQNLPKDSQDYLRAGDNIPGVVLDNRKWQSFRLSEFRAYQFILENAGLFNDLPSLADRASKVSSSVPSEIKGKIQLDRSSKPPLL